jgi:methyl-accepting chemotaxis protein
MTMIAIGLIGIFGGGAFGFILARFSINKPLTAGLDCLRKLSTGDSSVEIYGTGRKDEIGDLAAAMEVFKDNLIKSAEMQAREAEAQAERAKRAELIANLTQNFDQEASSIVRALAAAATEMRATASSMSGTAEETARQSSAVAAASEQTSANVQTVAAATEELSSSVVEIGRQVSESATMSAEAVRKAEETNTTVNSLSEAAKRIGSVVQLINDIASQTNLLALNATIEAARAGEAGKGFAVVASEVKNLANQTSKATDEIGQQIGSMQQATEAAVSAILDIKGIIGRLNSIATGIASAVEEQGAATQEISRNVQQAAEGTQDVSRNIVSVNQAANETGSAATQLLTGAEDLSQQAEGLRGKVETFISGVKSA